MLKRHAHERGQILPLIGIAMALLLSMAALAVDLGYQRYQQRLQQTAADSAAIAGAYEKTLGTNVTNAARQDAATNGFTDNGGTIKVTANSPPSTGNYTGDANAVEVVVEVTHPSFFAKLVSGNTKVTTRAVATVKPVGMAPPCMMLLNPSLSDNFNQDTVNAPGCSIVTNSVTNFTGASVTATSVECASTCSGLSSPTPVSVAQAISPCADIPGCLHILNSAPSTGGCAASLKTGKGNVTVNPGCYQGMDLTASTTVTLNCGLYIIYNGTLNANAGGSGTKITTLTQNTCGTGGVTFYITGTGSINIQVQNLNLAAPTAGDYNLYSAGEKTVLFYQDPTDTSTASLHQATCQGTCVDNLSGLLYFPTQSVNFDKATANAAGTGYPTLVFGSVNCNKCTISLTSPSANSGPTFQKPVLVE
jgi:hypothetical protein